jgi:acid stress-induced BolA-like protein IbaG/YrbA
VVYQALGDRMRAEIHALSMKTLTPAEWAASPDTTDLHPH